MAGEQENKVSTSNLIKQMMKQMTALQEKVDAMQKNPQPAGGSLADQRTDSDDEMEDSSGLVQLTETIRRLF